MESYQKLQIKSKGWTAKFLTERMLLTVSYLDDIIKIAYGHYAS